MGNLMVAVLLWLAPPGDARIEDLAWLSGTWAGRAGDVDTEEHWTSAKAGMLLGVHRDIRDGRVVGFEFLRIEATGSGLVYLASPQGRPATPFPLKELGAKRVVFENLDHDFPQRILYWLDHDGALHSRIEGSRDGKSAGREWVWRPVGH